MKQLTDLNYYEDDEYMSVSAFKKLSKCEVDGRHVYNKPTSSALLIGSYVDSYVEGTLDKFKEEHPDLFSTRGDTKGELKADYKLADRICEEIDNSEMLKKFLNGDKQSIMTGKINDVPFKIKMDAYHKDKCIVDLKVMRSVTNNKGEYCDFITQWGYDLQLGCYQEIVRQNTGRQLPCYIVALTKESPINKVIIEIPQEILDKALYTVETQIRHLYDVKMKRTEPVGCGVCKTCIALRKDVPLISMYDIMGID